MTSDDARHVPDMAFRMAQPSLPHPLLYLCGCKGMRAGGHFRGSLPMRCPKCNSQDRRP